jgi:hypothetical protein
MRGWRGVPDAQFHRSHWEDPASWVFISPSRGERARKVSPEPQRGGHSMNVDPSAPANFSSESPAPLGRRERNQTREGEGDSGRREASFGSGLRCDEAAGNSQGRRRGLRAVARPHEIAGHCAAALV